MMERNMHCYNSSKAFLSEGKLPMILQLTQKLHLGISIIKKTAVTAACGMGLIVIRKQAMS
uniref:Uncharacterized protein n=1 Tax=Rhizophora mucronata TaxID=61149 RepID=A0A2P2IVV4_RHIMU